MLHSLGKKPERDEADVVGRLVDCHARIREMVALASRIAASPRAPDAELVESAERVCRYFRRALVMHVKDEEESISPRLAKRSEALGLALAKMRREHRDHQMEVDGLVATCESLAGSPSTWSELAPQIASHADQLTKDFATHLEEEERDIFPAIAALDDDARAAIAREMNERRERTGGGGGGRGGGGGGGRNRA